MSEATADKLLRVGGKRVLAALGVRGLTDRAVARPPTGDPFAGPAALALESCRAGSVLVADGIPERSLDRLRQRGIAGIVIRSELRGIPVEAGDTILRDRDGLIVIPTALAEEIAEEAATAIAFEEFTADQVAQGGGVYGLHIPSGDRAMQAFAAWRRMKGR
jgi:regulator of RNase E activity RraA